MDIREGKEIVGPLNYVHIITISSLVLIPLCYILILQNHLMDYILLGLFILISVSLIRSGIKEDKSARCWDVER